MDASDQEQHDRQVEQAVAEGGAYEIIRKRLLEQGNTLQQQAAALNEARLQEFGQTSLEIIGRARIRTENNCVARDIVRVGAHLLFGYNVFIGLKTETKISDVFGLYKLVPDADGGYEVEPVALQGTFLTAAKFSDDFHELYTYYKDAHLQKLQVRNSRLYATFRIGEKLDDVRVFRWSIGTDGALTYIDNRGERDIEPPPSHDFEWTQTTRADHVSGEHPHVSILDEVFVETINGNLTVKVEDNTADGLGIYSEPVEDKNQSLADAAIFYAKLGSLILLKILPYREKQWRYLVFNSLIQKVVRIDALGQACIQLPEDHGVIFPGGYYLRGGETKTFGDEAAGMHFERMLKSPNGEDVMYIFYEPTEGRLGLFSYNLIRKELQTPLYAHGLSLFEDGTVVLFVADSDEPSRNHPLQVWRTPFMTDEHAARAADGTSFFSKIGNADLVRAISELFSIARMVAGQYASAAMYQELIDAATRAADNYYWLNAAEAGGLDASLRAIRDTAELVLDEFEKVEAIRKTADQALREAEREQQRLISELRRSTWQSPEDFVKALQRLQRQRGRLVSQREVRYINVQRIDELDQELAEEHERISRNAVAFLQQEHAFAVYDDALQGIQEAIPSVATVAELEPLVTRLEEIGAGLDLISEMMNTLQVDDATVRTAIIEAVSEVYAKLNQIKARANNRKKELGSAESVAEFGAQFTLFSQGITNALGLATTPEKCDEQLSRLLIQLEELESQYSEHDEFLNDIIAKREELYESFEARKQGLLDERQRKIQNLSSAADRILEGVGRRSIKMTDVDEINSYFAADPMVRKVREIAGQLREYTDSVRADDIESRLKAAQENAIRAQRDKQDIFEDDGGVIRLGKHRFSVNQREVDLTLVPRDDDLCLHITGTDYFAPVDNPQLTELGGYWQQEYESETDTVYRAEYLAASFLEAAEQRREGLNLEALHQAQQDDALLPLIRKFAAPRYQEGYEKGIHDHDAALIVGALLQLRQRAGLLRYGPLPRALAVLFWCASAAGSAKRGWSLRAQSAAAQSDSLRSLKAYELLRTDMATVLANFCAQEGLPFDEQTRILAAEYLSLELRQAKPKFVASHEAAELHDGLLKHLQKLSHRSAYEHTLEELSGSVAAQWRLVESWLEGYVRFHDLDDARRFIPEAAAMLLSKDAAEREVKSVALDLHLSGLLGDHPRIQDSALAVALDELNSRLFQHRQVVVPGYRRFLELRQRVVEDERAGLRVEDFKARPLSSFVRNRLINEVYLPILGDNLAKQMGSLGDSKRTDLMGLLLLISPPGYGKTTLMEYVANRMGLIFMKINCPSLGHGVHALDPQQAPNATARQELEKLNLAFEMGNNVMLYLDDIQHTHPEFLQKFISLCDGSRRIEGVWRGRTRTYDLRGKKFCVVMAGNPYTESGETFRIPDMLANRADIYNLGDVLSGRDEVFSLSYVENCLTSNAVLAPLATRDMEDVYRFIRLAKGEQVAASDFSHTYSGAEINEISTVLKKLFRVQDVVLKVNQQYIASAAQADKYRTEPPFKLQGSYRNMNKMAEKINAVLNEEELQELIRDHYIGEAQTLAAGAEENLLKLKELSGGLSEQEAQRWAQIKEEYQRIQGMGGDEADAATRVAGQISKIGVGLKAIEQALGAHRGELGGLAKISEQMAALSAFLDKAQLNVEVINQPVPGMDQVLRAMAEAITTSLLPVVSAMEHKLRLDHDIWERVKELGDKIGGLEQTLSQAKRSATSKTKKKISGAATKATAPSKSKDGKRGDSDTTDST